MGGIGEYKMVYASEKDVISDNINKGLVVRSDPKMIEISLYEIKLFLISGSIPKIMMLFGTLFVGSFLSEVISGNSVPLLFFVFSSALLVFGIILDVYMIKNKLRQFEERGAKIWVQ